MSEIQLLPTSWLKLLNGIYCVVGRGVCALTDLIAVSGIGWVKWHYVEASSSRIGSIKKIMKA